MKKIFILLFIAVMMFSSVSEANAGMITLNFDDISIVNGAPFNYNGFLIGGADIIDSDTLPGVYFTDNVLSSMGGGPGPAAGAGVVNINRLNGETFDFGDAKFGSPYNYNNYIIVAGYIGSTLVGSEGFSVNPGLQSHNFGFFDIDRLEISSSNGQYIIDDMHFNNIAQTIDIPPDGTPTPEPSSMILGLLSLGGLFGIRKRKNN